MIPCCCCKDLYTKGGTGGNRLRRLRVKGNAAELVVENPLADLTHGRARFDFQSKRLWSPASLSVYTFSENLGDRQLEFSISQFGFLNIWPSPFNGQFFWTQNDSDGQTRYVKRIDYDGNNETTLQTHTLASGLMNLPAVAVPREVQYVFYVKAFSSSAGKDQIRRCDIGGANDTLIFEVATLNETVAPIYVDNDHRKILWIYGTATGREFRRADMDGSNVETYLTTGVMSFADIFWSHKLQRVFYYVTTAGANRGFWGVNYDGTNNSLIVTEANWQANTTPQFVTPGCGFEVTGAGYRV